MFESLTTAQVKSTCRGTWVTWRIHYCIAGSWQHVVQLQLQREHVSNKGATVLTRTNNSNKMATLLTRINNCNKVATVLTWTNNSDKGVTVLTMINIYQQWCGSITRTNYSNMGWHPFWSEPKTIIVTRKVIHTNDYLTCNNARNCRYDVSTNNIWWK